MAQLWNGIARNYMDRFWWYLAEIFKRLYDSVCMFQFLCRYAWRYRLWSLFLSRYRLSNCIPKITRACCALPCSTWDADTCIFVNNPRNWRWSTDPPASREISLTVWWLWGLSSVGIDLKELGSAAEMFEILPRDWNLSRFSLKNEHL